MSTDLVRQTYLQQLAIPAENLEEVYQEYCQWEPSADLQTQMAQRFANTQQDLMGPEREEQEAKLKAAADAQARRLLWPEACAPCFPLTIASEQTWPEKGKQWSYNQNQESGSQNQCLSNESQWSCTQKQLSHDEEHRATKPSGRATKDDGPCKSQGCKKRYSVIHRILADASTWPAPVHPRQHSL